MENQGETADRQTKSVARNRGLNRLSTNHKAVFLITHAHLTGPRNATPDPKHLKDQRPRTDRHGVSSIKNQIVTKIQKTLPRARKIKWQVHRFLLQRARKIIFFAAAAATTTRTKNKKKIQIGFCLAVSQLFQMIRTTCRYLCFFFLLRLSSPPFKKKSSKTSCNLKKRQDCVFLSDSGLSVFCSNECKTAVVAVGLARFAKND